jgi:hypothetical protein
MENVPPAEPVPNPKETANGEVVGSDLVVSTERRGPEGQDNDLDEEFHNDSKAAALGIVDMHCISVMTFSKNVLLRCAMAMN